MADGPASRFAFLLAFGLDAAVWIALAALAGGLVSLHLLNGHSRWAGRQRAVMERGTTIALLALAVASVAAFWLRAAEMAERGLFDLAALHAVLAGTHVGRTAAAGFAALAAALCVGGFFRGRWSARPAWTAACVSALAFAASRSASGHAGASGSRAMLAADLLHVASASVWAGLVLVAAVSSARARRPSSPEDRADAVRLAHALSRWATGALAVVLATALAGLYRGLDGATVAPLATAWGAIVLLKIVLVGIAVQRGAHNRFVVMPRLDAASASARGTDDASAMAAAFASFAAVLGFEAVVLLAVLLAATALGEAAPPAASASLLLLFEPGPSIDEITVPT